MANFELKNDLYNHRKYYDVSQLELAKAVGVSRYTISSIERGTYKPSVFLALKISEFFCVPLEDVFYLVSEGGNITILNPDIELPFS